MNVSTPYRWAVIFTLMLLVGISFIFIRREGKGGSMLGTVSLGNLVQRIDDFHLTHYKGEDIEWEIVAHNAMIYNGEEDARIRDFYMTYVPKGGSPVKISAEKGRYNINANTLMVEKVDRDVDIEIGQGLTIIGSRFSWSGDKREIFGPGNIRVVGERFYLEGEDLSGNVDNGLYEIKKNIRANMWE